MADGTFYYSSRWTLVEDGETIDFGGQLLTKGVDAFSDYSLAKAAAAAGGGTVQICDKFYSDTWKDTTDPTVKVTLNGEEVELTIGTEAFKTIALARSAAGTDVAFVNYGFAKTYSGSTRDSVGINADNQFQMYSHADVVSTAYNNGLQGAAYNATVLLSESALSSFDANPNARTDKNFTVIVDNSTVNDLRVGKPDSSGAYTVDPVTGRITWGEGVAHSVANLIIRNQAVVKNIYLGSQGSPVTGEFNVTLDHVYVETLYAIGLQNGGTTFGTETLTLKGGTVGTHTTKNGTSANTCEHSLTIIAEEGNNRIDSFADTQNHVKTIDIVVKDDAALDLSGYSLVRVASVDVGANGFLSLGSGFQGTADSVVTVAGTASFAGASFTGSGTSITVKSDGWLSANNVALAGSINVEENALLALQGWNGADNVVTVSGELTMAGATLTGDATSITVKSGATLQSTGAFNFAGDVVAEKGAVMVFGQNFGNSGHYTFALEDKLNVTGVLTNNGTITVDAAGYTFDPGISAVKVIDASNSLSTAGVELVNGEEGKSLFAWNGDIYYGNAPGYYSAGWAGKTGTVNVPGGTATLGENAFATYDEYLAYDSEFKQILDRYSVAGGTLGQTVTLELPSGTIVNAVIDNKVFFAGDAEGGGNAWSNFTDYSGNEVVVYGGTLYGGRTKCFSAGGKKTAFYNYTAILQTAGDHGPNVCANNGGTSGEIIIGKGSHVIDATLGRDMSNTTDINVTIHVEDDATVTRLSAIFNKTATCSSEYTKDDSGKLVWAGGYSKAHFILTGGSVTNLAPTSYSGGFTGEITVDISGNAKIGTLAGSNVANGNKIEANFLINMAGGTIDKIDAISGATGIGNRYFAIVAGGGTTSTIGAVNNMTTASGTDVLVKENSTLRLNSGLDINGGVTLENDAAFTVQNLTLRGTAGLTLGADATLTCSNLTLNGGGSIALDSNASLTCTNLGITNAEITLASGASFTCATGLTTLTNSSLTVNAGESFMAKNLTTTVGSTVVVGKGAGMTIDTALTNAGSYTFALEDGLTLNGTLTNTGTITVDAAGYTLAPGASYVKVIDAQNDITSIQGYELINNLDPDKELFVMDGDIYYGEGPVFFSAAWRDLTDGDKVYVDGKELEIGKKAFQSNSAAKAKGKIRTQSLDIYVNNEWGASGTVVVDGYTVTLGEDAFNTVSNAVTKYASRTSGVINIVGGTYSPEGGEGSGIVNFGGKPTVIENSRFGSFFGASGSTDVDVTVRGSTVTSGAYAGGRYSVYNDNVKMKIVDSYVAGVYGNGLSPAGTSQVEIIDSTVGTVSLGRGTADNVTFSLSGSTVTSILAAGGLQVGHTINESFTATLSDSWIKTIFGNVGQDGSGHAKTEAYVIGDVLYKIEGGVTTVQSFTFYGGSSSSLKIQIAENATLSVGDNSFAEAAITVASGATFQLTKGTTLTSTASITVDAGATFDMKDALTVNASASISAAKGAEMVFASSFTNKGHYTFALEDGLTVSGGTLDNTGTITIDADGFAFAPGVAAVKVVDAQNNITSLAGYEVINGIEGKKLYLWDGDIWYGNVPGYYSAGWAGKTGTVNVPGGDTATLGVNAFATYDEYLAYDSEHKQILDRYSVADKKLGDKVTLELPSGTIVDAVIDNKVFFAGGSTGYSDASWSNFTDYSGNEVVVYGGTFTGGRTNVFNCSGIKTVFYNHTEISTTSEKDGPSIAVNNSGKKGEVIIGKGSHVQYVSRGRGTQSESDLDITIRMEDDATAKIISPAFYCAVSSTASFTKGENGEIIWNDAEGAHSKAHFILTGGSATHVYASAYSSGYVGDITLDVSGNAQVGDFVIRTETGNPTFKGNFRVNMAGGTIGTIDATTNNPGLEDRYFAIVIGGTNTTSTIGTISNIENASGYSIVINAKDHASLNLGGASTYNFTIDNTGFAFADGEHAFTVISGDASKLTYTLTDDTVSDYLVVQDDTGLYFLDNPIEISRKFEAYEDGDIVETYFGSGTVGVNAFRTLAEKEAAHAEGYVRFTDVFVDATKKAGDTVIVDGNTYTVGDGRAFNSISSARDKCTTNGQGAVWVIQGGSISSRTYLNGAPTYITDIDYPFVSGGGLVGGLDSGIEKVEVVFAGGSVGSYWSARNGVVQNTHAVVKGNGMVDGLYVGYSGATVVNALWEVIDGGYVRSLAGGDGGINSVAGGLWDYRVKNASVGGITLGNSNNAGAIQLKGDVSLTLDRATSGRITFSSGGTIDNAATYTFRITDSTVTGIGTSGLGTSDMTLVSVKALDFEATDSTIRQLHLYRISTTDKIRVALDNVTLDESLCLFNTISNNSFGSVEASVKNMALTNGVQVFYASTGYVNTVLGDASVVFDTVTLGGTSTNAVGSNNSLAVNGNLDVTLKNVTSSEKSFWLLGDGSTVGQNMTVTLADSDLLAIYNNGTVTGAKQLFVSGGSSSVRAVCDFDAININAGTLSVAESFGAGAITIADGATLRYGAVGRQPLQTVVNNGTFYYNATIGQNAYRVVTSDFSGDVFTSEVGNVGEVRDKVAYAAEVQNEVYYNSGWTEGDFLDTVDFGGKTFYKGLSAFESKGAAAASTFTDDNTIFYAANAQYGNVEGDGKLAFAGSTVTGQAFAGGELVIKGVNGVFGSYRTMVAGKYVSADTMIDDDSSAVVNGTAENLRIKGVFGGAFVDGGNATVSGATAVTVNGGSIETAVVGGCIVANQTEGGLSVVTQTGDATVNVNGGVLGSVIGGGYIQSHNADDAVTGALKFLGDTKVNLAGGTIVGAVIGGNAGTKVSYCDAEADFGHGLEKASYFGGSSSISVDVSGENKLWILRPADDNDVNSSKGCIIAGNQGMGGFNGNTQVSFTGLGDNLYIQGKVIGGNSNGTDAGGTSGITGSRSLIFDDFHGDLNTRQVIGFTNVSLTDSEVVIGNANFKEVNDWSFAGTESSLTWTSGKNDFAGDALKLTSVTELGDDGWTFLTAASDFFGNWDNFGSVSATIGSGETETFTFTGDMWTSTSYTLSRSDDAEAGTSSLKLAKLA